MHAVPHALLLAPLLDALYRAPDCVSNFSLNLPLHPECKGRLSVTVSVFAIPFGMSLSSVNCTLLKGEPIEQIGYCGTCVCPPMGTPPDKSLDFLKVY